MPAEHDPSRWPIPPGHDPLGILAGARRVLADATRVRLDPDAVSRVVTTTDLGDEPPPWDATLHWRGDEDRTVAWVFVLDTLNFCFWAPGPAPAPRWRVRWQGQRHDGYMALAAALSRAMAEGTPLTDPAWLASCTPAEVEHLLRPDDAPDATTIPLLAERVANLRELGETWQRWPEGGPAAGRHPAVRMVAAAGGSAVELVRLVTTHLRSFDDVATWRGERVPFHKRAQILVADLAGTFDGEGPGAFRDLAGLTAFADYKVPQVLRQLGILHYDASLAARLARYELIPAGDEDEVAIRAATVWGCELVRQALAATGRDVTAATVDWLLWDAGQRLPRGTEPYHRTPTIYY
jgi:hypothetical protein